MIVLPNTLLSHGFSLGSAILENKATEVRSSHQVPLTPIFDDMFKSRLPGEFNPLCL